MLDIMLLEIIAISAFLYSLFLVFIPLPSPEQFILFIWTVLVTCVFAALSKKSKFFELGFVLLLLPLFFFKETVPAYFIILTAVFIFIYVKKSLLTGDHHDYITNLKKTLFVYLMAAYVRSVLNALSGGSLGQASPYIVLYLFSSVLLIRSIRHIDSRLGIKRIRKENLKYTGMMLFVVTIATLEQFREVIRSLGHRAANLLAVPVYLMVKLIEGLINLISRTGDNDPGREPVGLVPEAKTREFIEEIMTGEAELLDLAAAEKILSFIFIAILLYILYQAIVKNGPRIEGLAFTEAREYITERDEKKRAPWRDRYPAEFGQQIRYYYRRYLEKLRSSDIPLARSDTSLDVNLKAEPAFGAGIESIRSIYIESRYGDKEAGLDSVQEIKQLYKDL